jgi:hypothetical protein
MRTSRSGKPWRSVGRQLAIAPPFKAHTGERAWRSIGDRLQGPCYQSRDDQARKIRIRKQRRVIGKYSFVNRTNKLWNQLPTEVLATFPRKSILLEKSLGK